LLTEEKNGSDQFFFLKSRTILALALWLWPLVEWMGAGKLYFITFFNKRPWMMRRDAQIAQQEQQKGCHVGCA
jgi:hypothetical protein